MSSMVVFAGGTVVRGGAMSGDGRSGQTVPARPAGSVDVEPRNERSSAGRVTVETQHEIYQRATAGCRNSTPEFHSD